MESGILVLGADGMLGFDLMRTLGARATGLTHREIEVTDAASVEAVMRAYRPRAVISTAGMPDSERCERQPAACFAVNAVGAFHVARASAEVGAVVMFVSTDYVFGGGKTAFTEEDAPSPINVYGVSKLAGEQLVSFANPRHYIVRSSWFFGDHVSHKGYDFPRLMLRRAKTQPFVAVVDDQRGTPTYTRDLARAMRALLDRPAPYGIYHLSNDETYTWFEFAQAVFELAGVEVDLRRITTAESGTGIRRPDCSALASVKRHALGLPPLRPLRQALVEYLANAEDLR